MVQKLPRVRKLLVALAGLAVIVVPDFTDLSDEVGTVFDAVVALLTAAGVFAVPNEPRVIVHRPEVNQ